MLEFIKENIGWIKDFVMLLFAGTATIIGVLTYRRARRTLLQPIRNEVIKKQSELLTELLNILRDNDQSFERGINYPSIVQLNVLKTLKDYGFIFTNQEELFGRIDKEILGWIPCGRSDILSDVEIIGTFESTEKTKEEESVGKIKYDKLKDGEIDIEKIYLSTTFQEFMTKFSDFAGDPFMPKSIQSTLSELIRNINHNLTVILKSELEQFILKFSKEYFKSGSAPKFNPMGVFNDFNHSRIHHRTSLLKLKGEIRKYLLIDEPL